jgi:hypothetical protein
MVKDLPVPLVGFCVDLTAQLDICERRKCPCLEKAKIQRGQ